MTVRSKCIHQADLYPPPRQARRDMELQSSVPSTQKDAGVVISSTAPFSLTQDRAPQRMTIESLKQAVSRGYSRRALWREPSRAWHQCAPEPTDSLSSEHWKQLGWSSRGTLPFCCPVAGVSPPLQPSARLQGSGTVTSNLSTGPHSNPLHWCPRGMGVATSLRHFGETHVCQWLGGNPTEIQGHAASGILQRHVIRRVKMYLQEGQLLHLLPLSIEERLQHLVASWDFGNNTYLIWECCSNPFSGKGCVFALGLGREGAGEVPIPTHAALWPGCLKDPWTDGTLCGTLHRPQGWHTTDLYDPGAQLC